ncbi:MAG TPA: glycosyltransferase family 4 protein [Pyrinomonadaceae bacterium]|jgi:glycosyltransferase involved in cell wall biosynthesis|nr:glycosyltransferase family 4 protein [Pyrinomonadaceae bacterium]
MRLAYFSPLNPQRSGISDYSEELLPHLAAGAEIDLFVDGFAPSSAEVRERFRFFDYRADPSRLESLGGYDAVVYHVGNDHRYHAGIYRAARAFPGVVVLHDFALQSFFLALARERGDANVYLDELGACHGARARAEASRALASGSAPPLYARPAEFPLNCRLLREADGVIVHSEWSRERLAQIAPATPCARINHHAVCGAMRGVEAVRGVVELASFGHVTAESFGRVLDALAALREGHEFRFTLVGEHNDFDARELAAGRGLADRVEVTGRVALAEFKARLAAADVVVSLRERTVGETSGTVCRALAAGVPVVVSNVGWYAELPDDCVVKIDAGEAGGAQLRAHLARLIEDEPLRRRIGANARRHALAEHSVEGSAARYLDFLRAVAAQRERRRFVRGVSDTLARCGFRASDAGLLRGVAAELARVAPARLFDGGRTAGEQGEQDV